MVTKNSAVRQQGYLNKAALLSVFFLGSFLLPVPHWQGLVYFDKKLTPTAAHQAWAQGESQDYTLCRVEEDPQNWDHLCYLQDGQGAAGDSLVNMTAVRKVGSQVVVSVPAKNCREKTGELFGGVAVVVDSSKSLTTTDPKGERLGAVGKLIDSMNAEGKSSSLPESDKNFPSLGVVSYGGRQGFEEGFELDGLNVKFKAKYCTNGDKEAQVFDSPAAKSRWDRRADNGLLISVCEFLPLVKMNVDSGNNGQIPSMARQKDFLKFTGANPRGSTDMVYFYEALQQSAMFGSVLSNAKNAIVITDGLPNIPKYVPEDECLKKEYLKKEPIVEVKNSSGKIVRVCIYRQPQMAADAANDYLLSKKPYSDISKFSDINIYNVLFAPEDKVFYDLDYQGRINPPDFLIENSARSGNGKVKFKWAKSQKDLVDFVNQTLERRFDKASLQRVTVQVSQNGVYHPEYNAVSPADTADSNKIFSIKFINLKTGLNDVLVRFIYSDYEFSRLFKVTVNESGDPSNKLICAGASSNKTVDGDDPASLDPKGDGVLPMPKNNTQARVYRNADAENTYNREALNPASGSSTADLPSKVPTPRPLHPRQLRIQGGTGNCGVVAPSLLLQPSLPQADLSKKNLANVALQPAARISKGIILFCILLPLLVAFRGKRLWLLLMGFSALWGLAAMPPVAKAEGLNAENFQPAIDNKSAVMWETARTIKPGSLLWAYTFSYALRPVEFGDGESKRLSISDHLQVNHFAFGYGFGSVFDFGVSLPLALFSQPQTQGYLVDVGSKRNFFFLGDAYLRGKFNFFPSQRGDGFYLGLTTGITLPTGAKEAMLSDGSSRVILQLPMHLALPNGVEFFFTPGFSKFGDATRLRATSIADGDVLRPVLKKSQSLLLAGGLRHWLVGNGTSARSMQWEAGVRGDFANQQVRLSDSASPVEWSAGAAYWLTNGLSVHGALGSGLGSGAGGPLARLVAGVRYLNPNEHIVLDKIVKETASSASYSDDELETIFAEARKEEAPPELADEETMLRLMTETEIIDIGAVNFEFNSSKLTEKAKQTVALLHEQLERLNPQSIKIDGHTDSVGSYGYNLALSKKRANSVRDELVRLGLDSGMITTEGFSYKYPVMSNENKEGRAKNRRIEVSIDGRSFRKATYTKEEQAIFKRWIYPNGKKPQRGD